MIYLFPIPTTPNLANGASAVLEDLRGDGPFLKNRCCPIGVKSTRITRLLSTLSVGLPKWTWLGAFAAIFLWTGAFLLVEWGETDGKKAARK